MPARSSAHADLPNPGAPTRTSGRRALLAGLTCAVAAALGHVFGAFDGAERGLETWRFRVADSFAPSPASDRITIFGIDDRSLEVLGEWSDWPRERLASTIDLLNDLGAHTIVLDIRFETPRTSHGDAALAAAMQRHGRVIIATGADPPVEPIGSAAVALGGVGFDAEISGVMLDVPRRSGFADSLQLGLTAAAVFEGRDPKVPQPIGGELLVPWIDRMGPHRTAGTTEAWQRALPVYSLSRVVELAAEREELERTLSGLLEREVQWPFDNAVLDEARSEAAFLREGFGDDQMADVVADLRARDSLDDEARRELAVAILIESLDRLEHQWRPGEGSAVEGWFDQLREMVSDRLVFVGWTATGAIADFVPTPLGARTPGVVVHAQVANGELTGFAKRRWPGGAWGGLITLAAGALGSWIGCRSPKRAALGCAAAVLTLGGVNAFALFDAAGLMIPLAAPMVSMLGGCAASMSVLASAVHRERAAIRRQFRSRIDPKLAARLERDPRAIKLDGELREVTVVFTDLSGYSALSELLAPHDMVALLNRLQTTIAEILIAEGGYINKFLGDGIMAIWGAPEADEAHGVRACRAVARAVEAVRQASTRGSGASATLSLRAGISTGRAIVGDCGAPPMLNDYTAVGDVVNIGARLAEVGTVLGAPVLLSGETAAHVRGAADMAWPVRPLGPIVLPGRAGPITVHELRIGRGSAVSTDDAVALFAAGRFDQAAIAWKRIGQTDATLEKLAAAYVARCSLLMRQPGQVRALIVERR